MGPGQRQQFPAIRIVARNELELLPKWIRIPNGAVGTELIISIFSYSVIGHWTHSFGGHVTQTPSNLAETSGQSDTHQHYETASVTSRHIVDDVVQLLKQLQIASTICFQISPFTYHHQGNGYWAIWYLVEKV